MSKIGRPPKYTPEHCETVKKLVMLGAKHTEIADFLDVSTKTIYQWKVDHPEFRDSINLTKEQYDERVVRSLCERAQGYTCKEEKVFNVNGELKTKTVNKHYPPDPTSMIFWLKNRQPDEWRDVQHHDNTNRFEDEEGDDLDLARKLVYLLEKGTQQLTH